jgi:magnesium chelatase family protein
MVARVGTVAFQGIEVRDVDVQVHIGAGLPAFSVVGLPDKAVAESRERVRAALAALGLALPPKRITVNLAPANLLKEGRSHRFQSCQNHQLFQIRSVLHCAAGRVQ